MIELKDIHKFWISFGLLVTAIIIMTSITETLVGYPEFTLGWGLVLIVGALLFMYLKWTIRFYKRVKFGVRATWD